MADEKFELVSSYQPTGDQPQAIETLVEGVERGDRCQTAGRYWQRQDLYHGKCDRKMQPPHAGAGPQ